MYVRYKLVSSYARYCIRILMIKVTNYQGFKSIVVGISSGKLLITATISTGREDNSTSFGHWSVRVLFRVGSTLSTTPDRRNAGTLNC